jgi:hypothetical protein
LGGCAVVEIDEWLAMNLPGENWEILAQAGDVEPGHRFFLKRGGCGGFKQVSFRVMRGLQTRGA